MLKKYGPIMAVLVIALLTAGCFGNNGNDVDPTYTVTVVVTDAETEAPIEGADVVVGAVAAQETTAVTDEEGKAVFTQIPAGDILVQVAAEGYESEEEQVTVSENTTVPIALTPVDDDDDDDDDDNDVPPVVDESEIAIRFGNQAKDVVYSLAGAGARDFSVWYYNKSSGDIDAAQVRVNFFEDGDEVAEAVTTGSKTLAANAWTKLADIAPVLPSGEYTIDVRIDYDGDGTFDRKELDIPLVVAPVGTEDVYETFFSVNAALAAAAPGAEVTLFEDVMEDIDVDVPNATLNLNGNTVNDVWVSAPGVTVKGSTVDGDFHINYDGPVYVADSVTITGQVIFEDGTHHNGELVGNPTILGDPQIVYMSISVTNAGELDNALMNQIANIYFSKNITQTSAWGDLDLKYDVTINLGPHTLFLDDVDLNFAGGAATVTAGRLGGIVGVTGSESINVPATGTLAGADDGAGGNLMNIKDVENVNVTGTLNLSDVQFDEGKNDYVNFDIDGGVVNIANYVTANDVEVRFLYGDAGHEYWKQAAITAPYGIVQGDGTLQAIGSGQLVVLGANYQFRGLNVGQKLTVDLPTRVNIDENPDEANLILANVELLDEVRLYRYNNVIVDDKTQAAIEIVGGPGVWEQGVFVGNDGTPGSEFRVVVNRDYIIESLTNKTTDFADITMTQLAFGLIDGGDDTTISEHTFRDKVYVAFPDGAVLTAKDNVYVQGQWVEFGYPSAWTKAGPGTFSGPGATVWQRDAEGTVVFSAPYTVAGGSWFTFDAPITLLSNVIFADLALNRVTYLVDATVYVDGDLIAYTHFHSGIQGRFVGSGVNAQVTTVKPAVTLYNLTFIDIDALNVGVDTFLKDDLGGTKDTNGLGVSLDVQAGSGHNTWFNVNRGVSLILENSKVRVQNDRLLYLNGQGLNGSGVIGAVRGTGTETGTFFSDTGRVVIAEDSNLALHGDGKQIIDLIFDIFVDVEGGSVTETGSVQFKDWVTVIDDAQFFVIGNKITNFDKGIDIYEGVDFFIGTDHQNIPLIPMSTDPDLIRGTIRGNNGAVIKTSGNLPPWVEAWPYWDWDGGIVGFGDLLKVQNFTLESSLYGVYLGEDNANWATAGLLNFWYDAEIEPGTITLDNVTFENHYLLVAGWKMFLDGNVYFVEDDKYSDWLDLNGSYFAFASTELHNAQLNGNGNMIQGDGALFFASAPRRQTEANDVNLDLRDKNFPYEVLILGGYYDYVERFRPVIFKNVNWTARTTVQVGSRLLEWPISIPGHWEYNLAILRFEGHNVNNGGLRAWRDWELNEHGIEQEWNLEYPSNINWFNIWGL